MSVVLPSLHLNATADHFYFNKTIVILCDYCLSSLIFKSDVLVNTIGLLLDQLIFKMLWSFVITVFFSNC